MRVKSIKNYNDTQLNRPVKVDEEFDVTEARAKVLVKAKVCEIITEPTPTTEEVVKPVTKTRKKKEA